jgi:hypothetical protein
MRYSLTQVVDELSRLDPALIILVDGIYAPAKAEPNDVDLLLISTHFNELSLRQYLGRVCPVEAVSVDLYVEPQVPRTLLDYFTAMRHGIPRGSFCRDAVLQQAKRVGHGCDPPRRREDPRKPVLGALGKERRAPKRRFPLRQGRCRMWTWSSASTP